MFFDIKKNFCNVKKRPTFVAVILKQSFYL